MLTIKVIHLVVFLVVIPKMPLYEPYLWTKTIYYCSFFGVKNYTFLKAISFLHWHLNTLYSLCIEANARLTPHITKARDFDCLSNLQTLHLNLTCFRAFCQQLHCG